MAWAFLTSTIAGGTDSSVTTTAIDTTGATFLVLSIARDSNTNQSVISDSKGNTWIQYTYNSQGFTQNILYYCVPTSVGTGHTFSNTGASNFCSLAVAAFSGQVPNHLRDVSSTNPNGGGTATVQPGSITPTQDNELLICSLGFGGTGSTPVSIDGGFTKTGEIDFSSGNYYGSALAYLIQTTATDANPTWTKTNANPMVACIVAFKTQQEVSLPWYDI